MRERIGINIVHSAILESEDEEGYRQFIGEVAGGTVGLGLLDWDGGLEAERGHRAVEVDQGGMM